MPIRIADLALDVQVLHADLLDDSRRIGGVPLTAEQLVRFSDPNALVGDDEVNTLVRRIYGDVTPFCRLVTKWSVGGFKAFNNQQTLPLRPINLIFGPNSSGKSSLLHSFLWANHAHATNNLDVVHPGLAGDSVDLGGFENTCYKHSRDNVMTFSFDLHRRILYDGMFEDDEGNIPDIEYTDQQWGAPLTVRVTIQKVEQGRSSSAKPPEVEYEIKVTSISLESGGKFVIQATFDAVSDDLEIRRFNQSHPVITKLLSFIDMGHLGKEGLSLTRELLGRLLKKRRITTQGIVPELGKPWEYEIDSILDKLLKSRRGLPKRELTTWRKIIRVRLPRFISSFSASAFGVIGEYLDGIRYLGPMRHYPDRQIFRSKQTKIEEDSTGVFAYQMLFREARAREAVNDWLGSEQRFQTPYRFEVGRFVDESNAKNELETLRLVDRRTNTVVSPRDIGLGVSQMLPVLVRALTDGDKTILIEQPELHIHPALQAEMGDLFITSALGGNGNQFILETHSEHLILRLLRRIRQSSENDPNYPAGLPKIGPEDVSVVYAQPTKDGTKLIPLRISPDGDFVDRWPDGFFTERGKELFT